jgi:hypothetical protein
VKRIFVLFGIVVLGLGEAVAAATSAGPPPSVYDIEVVVFENRLSALEGGETWSAGNVQHLLSDIATAREPDTLVAADDGLTGAVKSLRQDESYRVLFHQRWTQNAEARSATQAIRVHAPGSDLDGVFRFYLSRFLHVDMNLVLSDGGGNWKENEFTGNRYRLSEHRRIKTQEINYFDHPRLGVLVRVTQVGKP